MCNSQSNPPSTIPINPTIYYAPGKVFDPKLQALMHADGSCSIELVVPTPCAAGFATVDPVQGQDAEESPLWRITAQFPERIGAVYLSRLPEGIKVDSFDGTREVALWREVPERQRRVV